MTRIPDRPYTTLDRILERTLDFFDEFGGTDLKDHPEELDRRLANLNVLQRRIAAALWLFGDTLTGPSARVSGRSGDAAEGS